MNRRRTWSWVGLTALGIAVAVGFFAVLERRFAEGGLYPHYASFRSDPLGTSALYESLGRMDSHRVRRNLTHLGRLEDMEADTALLLLGYPRDGIDELRLSRDSPVLEAVREGGRLVVTLNPELVPERYRPLRSEEEEDWFERRRRLREEKRRKEKDSGEKADVEEPVEAPDEGGDADAEGKDSFREAMREALGPALTDVLGFELASVEEFEHTEEGWRTRPGRTLDSDGLPPDLPRWHSQYRFETTDDAWRTAVLVDSEPVVIERPLGKGTVVLATDSFFVSNEALHLGAEPAFLLWMLGGKREVVFDETIHGTRETGGAMKLIRRYRLHGVFFGLLVFVALWAWRSASSLAPSSDDLDRGLVGSGGTVAGEERESGLIRLLRRSLKREDLLEQCVALWRESRSRSVPAVREKEVDRELERHRRDPRGYGPVRAYDEIVEILRRR